MLKTLNRRKIFVYILTRLIIKNNKQQGDNRQKELIIEFFAYRLYNATDDVYSLVSIL